MIDISLFSAKLKKFSVQFSWIILSLPFFFIKRKNVYESSNGMILIRDYSTFLYPLRPERHSTLRIVTDPSSAPAEKWIIQNLAHERDSFLKAVTDFSEDMARDLMVFRKIAYHIKNEENGTSNRRNFVRLPGRLVNLGFAYLHFIPRQYSRTALLRGFKAEPSFIRKKEVFVFKLPRKICSWWEFMLLKRRLIASSKISPSFSMDDLKRNDPTPGYSFDIYNKANVIEMMFSMKKLGMQFNHIAESHVLGYYTTDLVLRFYRTLAIMRSSLISQLNQLLTKVGFDTTITLEGLPLVDEIENVRKELQRGSIDFAEAWKRIKLKDDE